MNFCYNKHQQKSLMGPNKYIASYTQDVCITHTDPSLTVCYCCPILNDNGMRHILVKLLITSYSNTTLAIFELPVTIMSKINSIHQLKCTYKAP